MKIFCVLKMTIEFVCGAVYMYVVGQKTPSHVLKTCVLLGYIHLDSNECLPIKILTMT